MRSLLYFMLYATSTFAEIDGRDGSPNSFSVVNHGRMDIHTVLMFLEDISLGGCIDSCVMHLSCYTVTYSPTARLCELNNMEFNIIEADTDANGWVNYGTPEKVDGGYSDWKNVIGCSRACGEGHVSYYRTCDNPKPQQGGANCVGDEMKRESCFLRACPVCYGAKDNDYGEFVVSKSGQTKAIRFIHINGTIGCHTNFEGRWGCSWYEDKKSEDKFTIFVTDENNKVIFPELVSGKTSYNLDGKSINDEEFTLKRITDIKVQKNQKFRIWDGI